ncbi:MAG: hypothetical protein FD152_1755 [Xanthobacteraceae bacterium]|nr:MAG: hypothetical protein FD152_1755 [Xanthobacteraceae bacterium]
MITIRAVAIAALTVFGWVLWALAVLMAIYFALAWRAGDPTFKLAYLGAMGLCALGGGVACRYWARRIAPDRR